MATGGGATGEGVPPAGPAAVRQVGHVFVPALDDEVLVSLTWRIERGGAPLACVYHRVRLDGDRIARVRVFLDQDAAAAG